MKPGTTGILPGQAELNVYCDFSVHCDTVVPCRNMGTLVTQWNLMELSVNLNSAWPHGTQGQLGLCHGLWKQEAVVKWCGLMELRRTLWSYGILRKQVSILRTARSHRTEVTIVAPWIIMEQTVTCSTAQPHETQAPLGHCNCA